MKREIPISKLLLTYFVRFLGVFLIIFTSMAFYLGFSNLPYVNQEGTIGMINNKTTEAKDGSIITQCEEGYTAYQQGIRLGDTIISVNNIRVTSDIDWNKAIGSRKVGSSVTLKIKKEGVPKEFTLTYQPQPAIGKILLVLFKTIPALLLFFYVVAGLYGIFSSPYSTETMLISLFCFCFGCFMYGTINTGSDPDNFVKKYLYFDQMKSFVTYIMWYAPSFWVLLFATFPVKHPFYAKNKIFSLFFIFLLPLIITALFFVEANTPIYIYILFGLIFINMWLGIKLLSLNAKRTQSVLEKRQIRLMSFALRYGASIVGVGWILVILVQFVIPNLSSKIIIPSLIVFMFCQIAGLIIPFAFLNSFFQNKLLETESALKRRVRYVSVTVGMLVAYLMLIFVVSKLSLSLFEVKDSTFTILFVLLLSLTFTPLNKRILKWVDEKFYPERTKYAESLKKYIRDISAHIERGDILETLRNWARDTTGISQVIPLTIDNKAVMALPFRIDNANSIINKVASGAKFFFWDEVTEKSRTYVNEDEIVWAKDNNVSLTIPMISQGEVVGLLNIGKKDNDEDFTVEDLDILSQASNQTALALQNMKLQSAFIEKKRMDRELDMARRIQKQLMPQAIPQIDGLDLSGDSRACYEIAGDYFDIIKVEDGNVAIVVADVSGKGAGAALIMANLQATIRLGTQLTDKFTDFVKRVNNLVYDNTSPSEFITFFMAVWNPKEKKLYYVNAGHNPPVVLHTDGSVSKLDATGLILGVLPDQTYEYNSVQINSNDVLVIYTDGLEEGLNANDEIFGLDRIIETIVKSKNKSSQEILDSLHNSVLEFCRSRPLHDDVTIVVAKGL